MITIPVSNAPSEKPLDVDITTKLVLHYKIICIVHCRHAAVNQANLKTPATEFRP